MQSPILSQYKSFHTPPSYQLKSLENPNAKPLGTSAELLPQTTGIKVI